MQPDDIKHAELKDKIVELGKNLAELDPGPLAELRRLNSSNPTAPMFWRFVSRFKLNEETKWAQTIQLMAILTDKGRNKLTDKGKNKNEQFPHDSKYSFGASLCDGAEKGWGYGTDKQRPMLSELRFARLLNAKGEMRGKLLFPAVRMLARKKSHGVNCVDLAAFLLSDAPRHSRKLARDYYRRLDRAENTQENTGENI